MSQTEQSLGTNNYPSVAIPIGDLAMSATYSGGLVQTFSVSYRGIVYTKTLTYSGTNITNFSQWTPPS